MAHREKQLGHADKGFLLSPPTEKTIPEELNLCIELRGNKLASEFYGGLNVRKHELFPLRMSCLSPDIGSSPCALCLYRCKLALDRECGNESIQRLTVLDY